MKKGGLDGVRIAVTRPEAQAEDLAGPLRGLNAVVTVTPLIRIVPTTVTGEARAAITNAATFDWIVFSSVNGVRHFRRALESEGISPSALAARIACVGPITADAAVRCGLDASVIPEEYTGSGLAGALAREGSLQGSRILLARAGGASPVLPTELRQRGAVVFDIELYRSVADPVGAERLKAEILSANIDVVTFTSASAVRYFGELVGDMGQALCAVIGPTTAETAQNQGFFVNILGEPHTIDGLVESIARHFNS